MEQLLTANAIAIGSIPTWGNECCKFGGPAESVLSSQRLLPYAGYTVKQQKSTFAMKIKYQDISHIFRSLRLPLMDINRK